MPQGKITNHTGGNQLDVNKFKNDPRVKAAVDYVKQHPKVVSDVLDEKGNQYVNLVQKGGGVLGVALVGYVYVLEEAGIRFLKMAGTSAGAINTSLMAIQKDKSAAHSDYLIDALSKLDLFRLVDGHPFARFLIKKVVKEPDFLKTVNKALQVAAGILATLLLLAFVFLGLENKYPKVGAATCAVFVLFGLYFLVAGVFGVYVMSLLKRLKTAGFGINPGDFFYDWVKMHMTANGIKTVEQLRARGEEVPELKIRAPRTDSVADLKGDVQFVTSELVTKNKFVLPSMAGLFRTPEKMDELQPAGFVRASMSIPLFFESYYIKDIPTDDCKIKKLWQETLDVDSPPDTVRFVDGGMLSNFPINLFYNKDIQIPRMPTFGVDLDDSTPEDKKDTPEDWSFLGYAGRMIDTMRSYYDKDFSLQNKIMNLGVGKVPVANFNWLNFFLSDKQKIELFAIGAMAAKEFLENFEWEVYRGKRQQYFDQLQNHSK